MINRQDVYANPVQFLDEINYYFNSNSLLVDTSFDNWVVSLLNSDNIPAYNNVFSLTKDIITGSSYRWYFDWIVPESIANGCYRIVIYDSTDESIKHISESLLDIRASWSDTSLIKYRNDVNIQNFNYEGLPDRFNQHRLWLIKRSPQRQKEAIGYNITDGTFERVRTTVTKSYEFVTEFLTENASDAFDVATIHSDMRINSGTGLQRYRLPDDSDFQQEWAENYNLADASVRLELIDYATSNKST